jgi:uncharacterized membrane protein YphA (DoxX/SURF4 family)
MNYILIVAAWLLLGSAEAHVKWFYQGTRPPLQWETVLEPLTLAVVGGVTAIVVALFFLQRRLGGRGLIPTMRWFGATDDHRAALFSFIPAILAVHFAVPLFVGSVQGNLFSPDHHLPGGWAYVLGLLQAGIALSLFYGGLTRISAAVLAWLWLASIAFIGLEGALDNALVLGFAGFFFFAGRGPISIDRLIFPRLEPSAKLMGYAMTALRIGIGVSFVSAAFTEKLANPALAEAFLAQFPLNFTSSLGLAIPNEVFFRLAGGVELLVGTCLIFNVFPREIIVIAWLPINLTLTVFDWVELVGHLPIYGAFAALLIWDHTSLPLWLRGLREGPLPIKPSPAGRVNPRDAETVT